MTRGAAAFRNGESSCAQSKPRVEAESAFQTSGGRHSPGSGGARRGALRWPARERRRATGKKNKKTWRSLMHHSSAGSTRCGRRGREQVSAPACIPSSASAVRADSTALVTYSPHALDPTPTEARTAAEQNSKFSRLIELRFGNLPIREITTSRVSHFTSLQRDAIRFEIRNDAML